MPPHKLILKKESFGGLFVDTSTGKRAFLKPEEYEQKKQELLKLEKQSIPIKIVDVTERGYPLLADSTSTPNSIFWEITKKCNGSCIDCFMDSNSEKWPDQEVMLSEIEGIVQQFSNLGGYYIRVTGGEPTTRKDFFDIIDLFNEQGINVGLNTNGFFDQKTLEGLLSRGIKDIRVSLDGQEKMNDSIRGEGSYIKATNTIRAIAEYNQATRDPVQLTINFVLMRRNLEHIEDMIELAQGYDATLSLGLLRLSGRAPTNEMLSPQEIAQAAYRVQQQRIRLGLQKGAVRINYDVFCEAQQDGKGREMSGYNPYPFDNSKCPLGSGGFTLDAFSRIIPCGYLVNAEEWVGEDIRNRDLLAIWYNSPVLRSARKVTREGCKDCSHHMVKCNGGCPAMAYFVNEDICGSDPYCIKDVDIDKITKGKT